MSSPAPAAESKAKWVPLTRDYEGEYKQFSQLPKFTRTAEHPLAQAVIRRVQEVKIRNASEASSAPPVATASAENKAPTPSEPSSAMFDDPLHMLAAAHASAAKATPMGDFDDPLRAMAAAPPAPVAATTSPLKPDARANAPPGGADVSGSTVASTSTTGTAPSGGASAGVQMVNGRPFESWALKKGRILQRYTTNTKIGVTANFLEEAPKPADGKPVSVDQVSSRLEQLETQSAQVAGGQAARSYLTQKEYIAHIEEQHDNLKRAWENGERVLSLKIAIQCAKLLGDTKVPAFYPSMFVLLSEILDTFGNLVFDRIKNKGDEGRSTTRTSAPLPDNFKVSDVSAEAQETCRNWFYKTSCIRELLPRLYIDLALLKCNRFLKDDCFPEILARLAKVIRGVGDPLAATYARAYLARKAWEVSAWCRYKDNEQQPLLSCFDDFLFTWRALKETQFKSITEIGSNRIEKDEYLDLFSPALEWLLQCIGNQSSMELLFALVQQYRDYCNHSAVLIHLIGSFDPKFISAQAMSVTTLIREAEPSNKVSKGKLYLTLGRALIQSPPPKNQRLPILNDVWKVVTKIQDPADYCEIAQVFVEYLLLHFSEREVNIFLDDVIKHVKAENAFKNLQEPLTNIIHKTLTLTKEMEKTLAMDNFLPLVDLLEKEPKVAVCKNILNLLANSETKAADPVILHTLTDVARTLHDSVDSLSFTDERRQISNLIVMFIRKIDFGRDLEKQLSTYVECRQAFTNLDLVTQELVLRVAMLAVKAHRFMNGKHNKKTAAFTKACLAYCHITIPSLDDIFARLSLFLQCGEVALVNGMIAQGEAFLKAAISLVVEVPATREVDKKKRSTEDELANYILNFTSFLLLFPGHPKHGPFYLVKGLLNAVQQYEPWKQATVAKVRLYLAVLQLFCAYYQRNFPYHIERVDSNDKLYGGDEEYMSQLNQFIDTLINEILSQIQQLGEPADPAAKLNQAVLSLDFVNLLVDALEMNPMSATLVVKLFQLAKRGPPSATPSAPSPAGTAKPLAPSSPPPPSAITITGVSLKQLDATLRHIQSKKGTWYADIAQKIVALE